MMSISTFCDVKFCANIKDRFLVPGTHHTSFFLSLSRCPHIKNTHYKATATADDDHCCCVQFVLVVVVWYQYWYYRTQYSSLSIMVRKVVLVVVSSRLYIICTTKQLLLRYHGTVEVTEFWRGAYVL